MSKTEVINETNFEEKVINSEGLVLVYFSASWCGPCKTFGPIVEELAEENTHVQVFKMDADDCTNKVKELGIKGIPTLLLFKDGQIVNRSTGAISKDKVKMFIVA